MTLLGSFIHGIRWPDLPAEARRQVRFCLLDTLAAARRFGLDDRLAALAAPPIDPT